MAEAQSLKLLKKKRKSLRTAVTKVVNELEAELSNSDLNVDRLSELVSERLLPQDRVRDAAVFEIIGLDLAGPLILKNGEKNWILILTCAVYRAIHLELLTSVSTESFLLGLGSGTSIGAPC
ncbi:integrase catalytic domain-containing protein [Trichonephila clavata]|uniref:Integrase catalytic domain-containing protein n=1 Tax=Trichonephila clavata TaxID=2740835 RepID=A0A8X6J9L4_TRICU|nr:integrase catalytic domain-containing protein [Trichonephila clavata]